MNPEVSSSDMQKGLGYHWTGCIQGLPVFHSEKQLDSNGKVVATIPTAIHNGNIITAQRKQCDLFGQTKADRWLLLITEKSLDFMEECSLKSVSSLAIQGTTA